MTLELVSKKARVSTATVSRVLNNVGVVKESTRRRVLRAVDELRYSPNLHARSLAVGRSNTLGMIVSNIRNPFFVDVFIAAEAFARGQGYEVVLEHTDYRSSELVAAIRSMIGRRVAGIALVVSEMDEAVMQELAGSGLPVALYDVGVPGPRITNIRVRYEVGMRRVVQYLYALGHRRMAFVGHHSDLAPLQTREATFLETVGQYGAEVASTVVVNNDTPRGAVQAVEDLLSSGFDASAIVCVNDYMAIGTMHALQSRGISVPGDVSVSGFDNIELSEFVNPPLTTVNIPRGAIGRMAVQALLDEKPSSCKQELFIELELVLRDSTGPVRPPPMSRSDGEHPNRGIEDAAGPIDGIQLICG